MAVPATRKGMFDGPSNEEGMLGNVSYEERNAWRWQLCGDECMAVSSTRKGMHGGASYEERNV